jgi:hypothetical protein
MNNKKQLIILTAIFATTLNAQEADAPAVSAPDKLTDAIAQGTVNLDARLRFETAEAVGLQDSDAFTGRVRLGYQTGKLYGFQLLTEFEGTSAINDEGNYDGFPGSAPDTHAVIADPESAELNRLQLSWQYEDTTVVAGRQRVNLDNSRFVGKDGWRQNEQTFDALLILNQSIEDLTLAYAWVDQVNRIYGADAPVGALSRLHANAHLFSASYAGLSFGKLTAYDYYLDVENTGLEDASTNTFGASLAGSINHGADDAYTFTYYAEYARQSDAADSTLDFGADYYHLNAILGREPVTLGIGYEVLGSDNGVSVQTPLASLHKFNGFADVFQATPAAGLEDFYIVGTCDLPRDCTLSAYYHNFDSEATNLDLGDEFDIVLACQYNKNWAATAKYADYSQGDAGSPASEQRFSLQLDYQY